MIVIRHSYISVLSRRRFAGSISAARNLAIGASLAHVKYIQHRPGQDRADGSRGFFNELEENLDSDGLRTAIRDYRGNRVVVHKLTIAPEINPADTETFTREVMHQLEDKKGLDLQWWAITHRNTDNHHVHVVVLSKDKYGRQVRFDKSDYQPYSNPGGQGFAEVKASMNRLPDLSDLTANQALAIPLIMAGAMTNALWGAPGTTLPMGPVSFEQFMFVGIEFVPTTNIDTKWSRPLPVPLGG